MMRSFFIRVLECLGIYNIYDVIGIVLFFVVGSACIIMFFCLYLILVELYRRFIFGEY